MHGRVRGRQSGLTAAARPIPMDAKAAIELVLLLLVVATGLAYLARRIGVAYPILLVLGGLTLGIVLGMVPDAPTVQLPPEVVFLVFLPPILFGSGYSSPLRDIKANAATHRPARHRARAVQRRSSLGS